MPMNTKASLRATTRAAQRLATRERLFTAAVAEFKRAGAADADVPTIVDEAGVAHGTFFFHFPTKEHVVAELGQREEARMAEELDRFLADDHDLRATLLEVAERAVALERRLGTVLFKDMLGLYFAPSRPELLLWDEHPLIERIVAEFERAHEAGEIAADAVDLANGAVFFFVGLYALLATNDRSPERAEAIEQYVQLLFRGLEPR